MPNAPLKAVCLVTSTVAKYDTGSSQFKSGPDVIKLFSCFHAQLSVEHEILNAYKCKTSRILAFFKAQLSLECYFSRSYMLKCQQLLAF